jgi:hypothetical protein
MIFSEAMNLRSISSHARGTRGDRVDHTISSAGDGSDDTASTRVDGGEHAGDAVGGFRDDAASDGGRFVDQGVDLRVGAGGGSEGEEGEREDV